MNHTIKLFLTVIYCLIIKIGIAQSGYYPGYVVTNKGDTLRGLTNDRREGSFARLHKKIKFKGKGIFTKRYSPNQIAAYAKSDMIFESKWIKHSRTLLREEYESIRGQGNKVFMQVIASGYLSLYHWEYIDYESSIVEYVPLYQRTNENSFVRVTQGIFGLKKKRLGEYFSDCDELITLINEGKVKTPLEILYFYNEWHATK